MNEILYYIVLYYIILYYNVPYYIKSECLNGLEGDGTTKIFFILNLITVRLLV